MIQIIEAESSLHFKQIAELATTIWIEHYTPIIGTAQVDYMLNKFQTAEVIEKQVQEGSEYYLLTHNGNSSGYFCVSRKKDSLFISKYYVLKKNRGKGIGKMAMQFIQKRTEELGYTKITLTVNKHNHDSIKAYEKMGFKNISALIQDIGNNYIMDDYLLEKEIPGTDS